MSIHSASKETTKAGLFTRTTGLIASQQVGSPLATTHPPKKGAASPLGLLPMIAAKSTPTPVPIRIHSPVRLSGLDLCAGDPVVTDSPALNVRAFPAARI